MNCSEYVNKYLSAHADGELTARELRRAEEHLGGCGSCRGRLADEGSLKAQVRRNVNIVKVPAEVRLRIRAAIGEVGEPIAARGNQAIRTESGRSALVRRMRVWAPVAAAASLLAFVALYSFGIGTRTPTAQVQPVPAFDLAIAKYDAFERDFVPNVPNDQNGSELAWVMDRDNTHPVIEMRGEVGRSYAAANMPDDLYNFDATGYRLDGGRIDRLPDGRPVTYTLYRRGPDSILSLDLKDSHMSAPIAAVYWLGMRSFYEYKGYSLCLTFDSQDHFVSITVTRAPLTDLIRNIALADAVATGSEP
jgi:Putative zinc-finger